MGVTQIWQIGELNYRIKSQIYFLKKVERESFGQSTDFGYGKDFESALNNQDLTIFKFRVFLIILVSISLMGSGTIFGIVDVYDTDDERERLFKMMIWIASACALIIALLLSVYICRLIELLKCKQEQMNKSIGQDCNVFRQEKRALLFILSSFVISFIMDAVYYIIYELIKLQKTQSTKSMFRITYVELLFFLFDVLPFVAISILNRINF